MRFKTIVAILQNEQDAERVLDCAIPLADRFESHLIGIHAEALPVPYTSATGFPDTEFLQVSADMNRERAEKLQALFVGRIENSGLSFEWRSLESFSGDSALTGISSVRAADLIIAAQRETGGDTSADVDTLVYDAGRPVLVVPHEGPLVTTFKHVLLAWNGSKEAARAAFDALPFIIEAEKTDILVIDPPDTLDDNPEAAGAEIAAALSRHGATVSVSVQKSGNASVDDVIQTRIAETGADLLVLGAYSHSWLRQLLFGGVTRTVLRSVPVAAFLSR
ncbi:universal stress protein [Mesorhizobium sp. LSJC268A00]|jgi:nucleotide-binding universal stress UspA family protein|uniref:universal stress protein n=1 Tax=unclassified Mesorhizobium TaxID=325217 RepID=UPI0003CF4013|nr:MULTISPECIES: universal stress protein [unclassified Mesorhizobium]ESW71700.1 universal stress protein [Mesorhizobium sp. LSJC277A00]ESW88207.1 universal stress protein [Mesorhizobium sp. LSJC269B00]ESX05867.1 universal stress protein [Mesorhizobium sp. LSJC268A00]ESX14338.1 universal stress protein [Mesorhizobium sp. LSJC265A00]ESX23133.1 universal stress protein [Mesorhizobium sp. LSJC264A00]